MTQQELDTIIERHQHWLKEDCEGWEGMRADLSWQCFRGANCEGANCEGANFKGADFKGANFKGANFYGANCEGANFRGANCEGANCEGANFKGANFYGANFKGANFYGANCEGADFRGANFYGTNCEGANFKGANFKGADFYGANFKGALLDDSEKYRLGKILTKPMTGYKKTREGVVITAEIPAGAIVFCINGSKSRTNRAKITDMGGHEVLHSKFNPAFEYRLGQKIMIKDFNLMYNVECARGFHFFENREDAENY